MLYIPRGFVHEACLLPAARESELRPQGTKKITQGQTSQIASALALETLCFCSEKLGKVVAVEFRKHKAVEVGTRSSVV